MKVYTPQQAADILQISPVTLLRFCRKGELKCSKIGRQWRITEEQITSFLKANEMVMDDEPTQEPEPEADKPTKRRYTKRPPDNRPPEERLRLPDVL